MHRQRRLRQFVRVEPDQFGVRGTKERMKVACVDQLFFQTASILTFKRRFVTSPSVSHTVNLVSYSKY